MNPPAVSGLALLVLALLEPSAAQAQRRPDVTTMSCGAARALIARSGAIVVGTGGHTYDRIVLHRGFCTPTEMTIPVFARTQDQSACHIGERCEEIVDSYSR